MRTGKLLIASLVVLSLAVSANASPQVWFTATSANTASAVTGGGNAGQLLDLTCNIQALPIRCEWVVNVMYRYDVPGDGPASWAIDLFSSDAQSQGLKTLAIKAPWVYPSTAQGNPYAGAGSLNGAVSIVDSGGALEFGANGVTGANFGNNTTPGFFLAQFHLSKRKNPPSNPNQITFVDAQVGDAEFGSVAFGAVPGGIQFANNPAVQGFFSDDGGNVIRIRQTPEPATISLLGLGALALIRRRR